MISRLIDYWHIRLGIIVLLQETSPQRFTFKLNLVLVLTDEITVNAKCYVPSK